MCIRDRCETIYTVTKDRLGDFVRSCTDKEMAEINRGMLCSLGITAPVAEREGLPCCLEAWLCMYNIELPLIDEFLLFPKYLIVEFFRLLTCLSLMISCCWMQLARSQGGKQLMSKINMQNSKRYVH